MVGESVEWIVKKRKVFQQESIQMKMMGYLRLDVIDNYNQNIDQTDIADQLRGQYRPDCWIQHKKWWWAIFGGALVFQQLMHINSMSLCG
jgi:hypothetical protein